MKGIRQSTKAHCESINLWFPGNQNNLIPISATPSSAAGAAQSTFAKLLHACDTAWPNLSEGTDLTVIVSISEALPGVFPDFWRGAGIGCQSGLDPWSGWPFALTSLSVIQRRWREYLFTLGEGSPSSAAL